MPEDEAERRSYERSQGERNMYWGGRWVPSEVVNTIFIAWAVAAIVLGAFVLWLSRKRRSDGKRKRLRRASRGKRSGRSKQ